MLHIRKAEIKDFEFILDGILASEKSNTDILSYCKIFSITENQVRDLITAIFEEEIENQEWNMDSFYIAEINGEKAACVSAWTEGKDGIASGILKVQAMSYILGNVWNQSAKNLQLAASVQIPRLTGALQIENIYTAPQFRGQGIAGELIKKTIEMNKTSYPDLTTAEIQLMANNQPAVVSYTKCGFLQRTIATATNPDVLNLLPGDSKISLVKNV